jgi:hypothetical protein
MRGHPDAGAKLSHALRRASDSSSHDFFSTHTIEEVLRRPLPRPKEQADLLIRWLAQHSPGPGELISIAPETHAGVIGAKSPAGFALIVDHLFSVGMLTGHQRQAIGLEGHAQATLSFAGWEYYEQLAKGSAVYRKAFMKVCDP